jgi:hypothetical protein
MTPQEQYPKFYSHPERYLGIEVECIKSYFNPVVTSDYDPPLISEGETYKLSLVTCIVFNERNLWDNWQPLFKPQEGEQFIKDLEAAVSCATGSKYVYRVEKDGQHILNTGITSYDSVVRMPILNLSLVKGYQLESGLRLSYFDTAAYVDKLRELGYYI